MFEVNQIEESPILILLLFIYNQKVTKFKVHIM